MSNFLVSWDGQRGRSVIYGCAKYNKMALYLMTPLLQIFLKGNDSLDDTKGIKEERHGTEEYEN